MLFELSALWTCVRMDNSNVLVTEIRILYPYVKQRIIWKQFRQLTTMIVAKYNTHMFSQTWHRDRFNIHCSQRSLAMRKFVSSLVIKKDCLYANYLIISSEFTIGVISCEVDNHRVHDRSYPVAAHNFLLCSNYVFLYSSPAVGILRPGSEVQVSHLN